MADKPAFLNRQHGQHVNGATIVAAFRQLPLEEAAAVDKYLMAVAGTTGDLTWQEQCLYRWINESDEAGDMFA